MIERRREARRRCFLGGKLAFNHRQSVFDCVVHNVADGGALIALPAATALPAEFELHIAHWQRTFRATAIWSHEARTGVKLSAFVPDVVSLDDARSMKALKKENRRLKALTDRPV